MSYNILIVDDSATMRSVIKRTVQLAQLPIDEFLEAGNGIEALEVLQQHSVDLVLTDINMPEMDGFEMTECMQKDQNLQTIPVVVISTEARTTRIDQLKQKGIAGYVHKPFTPEKIRDVINSVLGVCHVRDK